MKYKLKNIVFEKGFLLTFAIAMCCMILFFGNLLKSPNSVYFGASDDGLQAYYGAIYHVKHDTTYWQMNGMNYPYGEQVFFTGCQPFVTNPIKLISKVVDISNYTVGILNCIMLFSVFFSVLCLYLILKHLRLPFVYSAIVAVGIGFLSPQILRLSAHYSLTYQFAIPLFLLLLLKFEQSPTIKKSLLISIFVFFMAGTHFYFFGFFAIISVFYWAVLFFSKKINFHRIKFISTHIFIQIVLPFLLFQLLVFLLDSIHDRTQHPWGYLTYIANLAGVFYPSATLFYEPFFASFILPEYAITIEGVAYVGVVATLIFVLLVLIFTKKIIIIQYVLQSKLMQFLKVVPTTTISLAHECKKLFLVTDNKVLNAFCWSSLFALVLSFGYPFKIKGCEGWLDHVGLLSQMRGIARFAWIFYYVFNIIAFYKIYQWILNKNKILKNVILFLTVFFLCYDAYYNSNIYNRVLNNSIPRLEDKQNNLPEDKWLKEINFNKYQAIITLPYFHVGSENIWMIRSSEIIGDVYITSIKTGLPTMSSLMSRTSLSQTYKNISLVLEPYRRLQIINDFKNKKPFLVLVRESELNDEERKLLTNCTKIKTTSLFDVYELSFEKIENISNQLYSSVMSSYNSKKRYKFDGLECTDSVKTFVYNKYYKQSNNKNYFEGRLKEYNVLYYDTLPNFNNTQEQEYTISFWMDNFTKDLYPRTRCVFEAITEMGVSYNREDLGLGQRVKIIDGHKALIEGKIKIRNKKDLIGITMWHNDVTDGKKIFRVNDLLIRPTKDSIYKLYNLDSIMINNRIYLKRE